MAPIDGQEIGEISSIPNEELKEIDKEGIQYEITVLEEKLAQMKPNMTAIAEYRKKVSCFIIRMYWTVGLKVKSFHFVLDFGLVNSYL